MRDKSIPNLVRAKALIERIRTRNLYVYIGKSTYTASNQHISKSTEENILREIVSMSSHSSLSPKPGYFSPVESKHSNGSTGHYNHYNRSPSYYHEISSQTVFGSPIEFSQQSTQANSIPFSYPISNLFYENSNNSFEEIELKIEDLIVEKMIINYGKKNENPVSYLRFFEKSVDSSNLIGKKVPEDSYLTHLPRCFEELAIRVFCRHPKKEKLAREAFEKWCTTYNSNVPFP